MTDQGQTKRGSMVETVTSTATGLIISTALNLTILPAFYLLYQKAPLTAAVIMATIFTIASLIRGYYLRRFFENARLGKMHWLNKIVSYFSARKFDSMSQMELNATRGAARVTGVNNMPMSDWMKERAIAGTVLEGVPFDYERGPKPWGNNAVIMHADGRIEEITEIKAGAIFQGERVPMPIDSDGWEPLKRLSPDERDEQISKLPLKLNVKLTVEKPKEGTGI